MKTVAPVPYATMDSMGPAPQLEWIPVAQMFVDREYQRSTESAGGKALIETISREFHWAKFQVIVVTRRSDGMYSVIDGQHRRQAGINCGLTALPCIVVDAASIRAEADIFVSVNSGRVAVQPYQMFWSKLAAGRPDAVAIKAVCDAAGVTIPRSLPKAANTSHHRLAIPAKSTIAIAAISSCIRTHGAELTVETLKILVDAFPEKGGQIRHGVIKALSLFLRRRVERLDRAQLVSALADKDMIDLEAKAAEQREKYDGRADLSLAAQIAELCQSQLPAATAAPLRALPPPSSGLPQNTARDQAKAYFASVARSAPIRAPRPAPTAVDKSILTCGCKRQFRPERQGQTKCNICLDKYSTGEPIEATS